MPSSRLERCARRAHVHARRMLAVLAHHRQRLGIAGALVAQAHLADPLRIGLGPPMAVPSVLVAAGGDAIVAVGALRDVDQQAPALQRRGGLLGRARLGELDQPQARRQRRTRRGGRTPTQELAAVRAHGRHRGDAAPGAWASGTRSSRCSPRRRRGSSSRSRPCRARCRSSRLAWQFDAVLEAEARRADALVHREVALVQEHLHVVAAHLGGGCDALAGRSRSSIAGRGRGPPRRRPRARTPRPPAGRPRPRPRSASSARSLAQWSPMPILM